MWDPEFMGIIWEYAAKDPTWMSYQRERLELTLEHLEYGRGKILEAAYDAATRHGRLTVRDEDGSVIVATEVRRWA